MASLHQLLSGTGVALVTPFFQNGQIDFQGLENLLAHTYADKKGVQYWVVQGTTGETATLTPAEKKQVLDFVRMHNAFDVPIVYGIGGNNTQALVEEIRNMDFNNICAILSVSPYYNKPSQRGIIAHYEKIADTVSVPVILYNVPSRTGANMTAETTIHLSKHPNIKGIKEASGDLNQIKKIAENTSKDFLIISGDDLLTPEMIVQARATGVISVLANAFPTQFSAFTQASLAKDTDKIQEIAKKFERINPLMYEEGNPVGIKYALHAQKICNVHVRLPLVPISDELKQKIDVCLKEDLGF